ncbi:MAG: L,D-transpeptidase [Melioribacteraceae bacterium]|nr:L,D-transpeptidase [Melioribacteraceae bacterium]MCF8353281.1 L,D-transpeptidase [Melioribacteraceae bacterium]MCF8394833.1 L,D-transpeptidase [Melioribacteraceae bacterium]MCF8418808.1 L,D-transpeptidase [Melioribacteraceae bacterium]
MLKNILYFGISAIIFFAGIILYGIILNIREVTLAEAMNSKNITELNNIWLKVSKENYRLALYSDSTLVKNYKVVFGQTNKTLKVSKLDRATPTGEYQICEINDNSEYYKFLHINYPNLDDAAEALKYGVIEQVDYKKIVDSHNNNDCPPKDTMLGSNIGLHGIGEYDFVFRNLPFVFNWTNGSIAMSNDNIDELSSVVSIGTKIIIQN